MEIYEDNLILISASGILAYSNNPIQNIKKDLHFKQIKTNINKFIGEEQFKKSRVHDFDWLQGGWFSIKDINIYKDQIYVSYTREVKENCWNTSLLHGKMNLKLIIFENLFTSDECVHFYDNIDGEFNAHQSGGRIINVDDQNLFFSTGDFRSRFRAQKEDSIFSKIIEINFNEVKNLGANVSLAGYVGKDSEGFELIKQLIFSSYYVGTVYPGNGSLILSVNITYNKK